MGRFSLEFAYAFGEPPPPRQSCSSCPGNFYTVREVEENGWGMRPRLLSGVPARDHLVNPDTQLGESGLTRHPGQTTSKRPAPSNPEQQPSSKRVATSQMCTGMSSSLASTSNGAINNLINITEVSQCPNFWGMPVHALYNWTRTITILDRNILGYYEQALKEAENDLDRASSEAATLTPPDVSISGLPSAARSGWKSTPRAIRLVKEETPAPSVGATDTPAFKFRKDSPNRLDLIFMRALEAFSPFGTPGQKGRVFHECAIWLKTDKVTSRVFGDLSDSPNSRVLQSRYTQLKTWLAAAKSWSKMDSGTDEDDEELRGLIHSVQDEEEEERAAVKGRSLLAEAVWEEYATKAVENLKASLSDGDKDPSSSSSSKNAKDLQMQPLHLMS